MDRTIYPGFSTGFNRPNNLPASGISPDALPSITVQLTPDYAFSLFEPFTELQDEGTSTTYTVWLTRQGKEYAEKSINELWEAIQRVGDALELDWRLGHVAIITEKNLNLRLYEDDGSFHNYTLLQLARLHQNAFQQHFEEPDLPIQPLQLYIEWDTTTAASTETAAAAPAVGTAGAAGSQTTGGGALISHEGAGQAGDQWVLVGKQENEDQGFGTSQ